MTKKNKVLLISQFFWPESFPINPVIKGIKELDFTIITAKPNYPDGKIYKKYLKSGALNENFYNHTIYHVPVIPRKSGRSFQLFLNYISFLCSSIYYGLKYLRKKKFDVVMVYNTSPITQILVGYFFKKFFNVKLATWVQDIWPESVTATDHINENFFFYFFKKICHKFYTFNDILFLQSNYFKKYFNRNKIKTKKVYIPNTSNIEIPNKNFKRSFLRKKSKFNIVYAGNIGMAQHFENFDIYLNKIYKKKKEIKFHLIGSGSYKKRLIDSINKKKIKNVEIYPYIKNKHLYGYLKEADILFLSLKNKYILNLTVPSKLQNYLFCGKPVLAWADGATKAIIDEAKCGIAIKPGSIEKLILSTLNLLNKNKINKLGKNSKLYYKRNFKLEVIKLKLLKNIFKLIND